MPDICQVHPRLPEEEEPFSNYIDHQDDQRM
jgi:hypothetical protein